MQSESALKGRFTLSILAELCFVFTFSSKPCDAFKESPNWSWFIGLESLAWDHLFNIGFVE